MSRKRILKHIWGATGGESVEIWAGNDNPNGLVASPEGSIYIHTGEDYSLSIFKKITSSNLGSGWVSLTREATVSSKGVVNKSTAINSITTPDATDEATAISLANANKAKINEMLTKLRTAGILEE